MLLKMMGGGISPQFAVCVESQVALLSLQITCVLSISYFTKCLRPLLSFSGVPAKAAGRTHGT